MPVTGNNYNLNKSLSIRLCTDGFSFSAYSPNELAEKVQFIQYEVNPDVSMAANLKEALNSLEIASGNYHSIQILVDGSFCHVPFECFEEEEKDNLFYYNFPYEKGKKVFFNILTRCNIAVLFALDKSVYQLLMDRYPDAHYYSVETPILEHLLQKSKTRETQKLYAIFQPSKMSVFVMNAGKLSFANYFSASENNDYLYFLLQVWKSQGMDQLKDELHLIGTLSQHDTFVSELRRYVKQVFQVNPSAEFNRSAVAQNALLPYDLITLLSGVL